MQLHTYLKPRWYFISSFILKSAINSKLEMLFGIRISNNKIYYNNFMALYFYLGPFSGIL